MFISGLDTLWILAMLCIITLPIIFTIKAATGSGTSETGYYLLALVSVVGILGIVLKALDMGGALNGLSREFTWTLYIAAPVLAFILLVASGLVWDDYYIQKEKNESLKKIEKSLAYYGLEGNLYETIKDLKQQLETAKKEIDELTEATTSPELFSA